MTDYSKGKVYIIECDSSDKVYIGSTVKPLKERFKGHYLQWKKRDDYIEKGTRLCASIELFDLGECSIRLLEKVNAANKKELIDRERYWYDQYPEARVNKYRPIIYREDRMADCALDYRKNIEKRKAYRNSIDLCECGDKFTRSNKIQHLKSGRHKNLMDALDDPELHAAILANRYSSKPKQTKEEYRLKQKENRNVRTNCPICGTNISKASLSKHRISVHNIRLVKDKDYQSDEDISSEHQDTEEDE